MQDSKKPIIQSIRDYVMMYPDIDDRKINIDYLGTGMEYSIDPIGADPIYKRYVDGTQKSGIYGRCRGRKDIYQNDRIHVHV